MTRTDAISRDRMLELFNVEGLADMSASAKRNMALRIARRHKLDQYPDPKNPAAFLFSKSQCEAVWNALKPVAKAA